MSESTPIRAQTVDIGGGTELYYEESGSGRPLVFVHGLWASSRFFRPQLLGLSRSHRVIALDLRGHGRSSMTPGGHTMPQYARDLEAFLARLRIERAIAIGWSMGAFVWWDYYRQFGADRIDGLVVIDQPPTDMRSPDFPNGLISVYTLRDWHEAVQMRRNDFMREVLPMMFGKPPAPDEAQWMCDEMMRAPPSIAAAVLVDQSFRDYRDVVRHCTIPTLVCSGRLSAQPPEGSRLIVETAPAARLEIFEHSGHSLFFEEPAKFNAVVEQFASALVSG